MFKSFELSEKGSLTKFQELPLDTQVAILSDYDSISFEYDLKKDIHGKTIDKNSIFFKIQKVGLILFKKGIGFLYFKTNIESSDNFESILNFNYKFNEINQNNLQNYDGINIQTDLFENIQELHKFINNIIGDRQYSIQNNLDMQKFFTYSYTCINQNNWNINTEFANIEKEFNKYVNVMPNDIETNITLTENIKTISNSQFSKIGISNLGVNLLCSECDINNYTVYPHDYENKYFYTYIFALYIKIYLKTLNYKFKEKKIGKKMRKEFIEFTKEIWLQEVTSENNGSIFYNNIKEVLEIDKIYNSLNNKYNILYNELKIDKNEKLSIAGVITLIVTFILNIINLVICFKP